MAKSSGGTRSSNSRTAHGNGGNLRTGPGFSEPIKGPTVASSPATEIQYVYVDKTTGNYSDGYKSEAAVKKDILRVEKDDKREGIYEPDNYYIERIEQIKGRGRAQRYLG